SSLVAGVGGGGEHRAHGRGDESALQVLSVHVRHFLHWDCGWTAALPGLQRTLLRDLDGQRLDTSIGSGCAARCSERGLPCGWWPMDAGQGDGAAPGEVTALGLTWMSPPPA